MTEPLHDPLDPAFEGERRAAARWAHLEASQANAADLEAHRAISERLRASQSGLYAGATGQQLAALASRTARVGDGVGSGRDLVRLGGIDFESQGAGAVGPVPHRADLTQLNAPPGYMRTEHPLKRLHEGRG